ncbi:hypothetical protein EV360DRAFT_76276 [Lentinula raphanica]|nr:hypothetical protein EV360DRAFT_76276 [Lentinula raphanica]
MKPLTGHLLQAIETFQTMLGQEITVEIIGDKLQRALVENDQMRNEAIAWMASNIRRVNDDGITYPDEGIFLNVLTAVLFNLVTGSEERVEEVLIMFEGMVKELKEEFFEVPPQHNLFHIVDPIMTAEETSTGSTRATKEKDNTQRSAVTVLSNLSDLSDLTDISDFEEAPEETRQTMKATRDPTSNTHQVQGRRAQMTKAEQLIAEENEVDSRDPLLLTNLEIMTEWGTALGKIVGLGREATVSDEVIKDIVAVIRKMKKLPKRRYNTPQFRRALKRSGVTEVIERICAPTFMLLNRNTRLLWLEHVYRVSDQLAEVLDKWTPESITRTWREETTHFMAEPNEGPMITTPKEFIDVFNEHRDYVPGEENLSYCFFLTSLESFIYHYDRWLGRLLDKLGYNVTNFNDVEDLKKFYPWLMSQIHEWCTMEQYTQNGVKMATIDVKTFTNERWRIIIKKTWWLRQLQKQTMKHAKDLTRCRECEKRPLTERCCRYIYKRHITSGMPPSIGEKRLEVLREEIRGAGVTKVPKPEQVHCKEDSKYANELYHPDSVGITDPVKLEGLEPAQEIIQRCGHQLMIVLDEEDTGDEEKGYVNWETNPEKDIVDFMWWNPFDDEKLAILQDTIVESGQFRSFGGGKMIPVGARSPAGGREGDAYTSYAGLEASTQQGLEILFSQAATSVIMQAAAKVVHPNLARDLKDSSIECDRIGMMGANIFNCTGYMAPIHQDQDMSRGLCVQALLSVETEYKEYAFCNIEYQYYITTTTNCMWSFKSSNLHGTMLPSIQTIKNLNSQAVDPARIRSGSGNEMANDDTEGNGGENTGRGGRGSGRGAGPSRRGQSRGRAVVVAGAARGNPRKRSRNASQNRGRVTVSNGAHVSVPRRNQNRAEQNARRRAQYGSRSGHWHQQ